MKVKLTWKKKNSSSHPRVLLLVATLTTELTGTDWNCTGLAAQLSSNFLSDAPYLPSEGSLSTYLRQHGIVLSMCIDPPLSGGSIPVPPRSAPIPERSDRRQLLAW